MSKSFTVCGYTLSHVTVCCSSLLSWSSNDLWHCWSDFWRLWQPCFHFLNIFLQPTSLGHAISQLLGKKHWLIIWTWILWFVAALLTLLYYSKLLCVCVCVCTVISVMCDHHLWLRAIRLVFISVRQQRQADRRKSYSSWRDKEFLRVKTVHLMSHFSVHQICDQHTAGAAASYLAATVSLQLGKLKDDQHESLWEWTTCSGSSLMWPDSMWVQHWLHRFDYHVYCPQGFGQ